MGLDIVEFVISVEEEFQIEIPSEISETFVSPKIVIDYLTSQLQGQLNREAIAEKVWKILVNETGINLTKFDEDSRFVEDMGLD